jgi:hypothetical protein
VLVDGRVTCQLVPTNAGALVSVVQVVPLVTLVFDWTAKLKSDAGQERTLLPPMREALTVGLADN